MGGFLDYISGNSFLHRLNPLSKLLLALVLCVVCFINQTVYFVLGIIILTIIMSYFAGVSKRCLKSLKALSKLSLMVFVVQIFFVPQGNVLLQLPLGIVVTDIGLNFSLLFALRLLASTLPLILMLSITQMSDLANVMVEKLGIPYKYTFALTTAIRFIPVFSAEMSDIMEAQIARGVEFDTKNFFKKIKLILPLCVPLLISSVKKINSGAMAAALRGFYSRKKGGAYKEYKLHLVDYLIFLALILLIVLAVIL